MAILFRRVCIFFERLSVTDFSFNGEDRFPQETYEVISTLPGLRNLWFSQPERRRGQHLIGVDLHNAFTSLRNDLREVLGIRLA